MRACGSVCSRSTRLIRSIPSDSREEPALLECPGGRTPRRKRAFRQRGQFLTKEESMKTIKILLVMFLFAGPINAQQLVLKDALSIGVGSIFAEEAVTFNPSALFFAMHWRGLELPLNISSGVCLELSHRPDAPAANVISYTV